jgi:hypothetical protein
MIVRPILDEDIQIIHQLNELQADFKLNNFDNIIIERLAFDGKTNIAYGVVKKMAEAIILLNPNVPAPTRVKALTELMEFAEFGTSRAGLDQLHCFVKDEKLARMLENKFKFIRTKDIVLVKNLG